MDKINAIVANLEAALLGANLVPRVEPDSLRIEDARVKVDNGQAKAPHYKCVFCRTSLTELILVFRRFALLGEGNTHLACINRVACAERVVANAVVKAAAIMSDEDKDKARRTEIEDAVFLPRCENWS